MGLSRNYGIHVLSCLRDGLVFSEEKVDIRLLLSRCHSFPTVSSLAIGIQRRLLCSLLSVSQRRVTRHAACEFPFEEMESGCVQFERLRPMPDTVQLALAQNPKRLPTV